MKFIVMTIMGFLLNILCLGGLGIISWIIVFIPFVLMTIITAMLLYAFGLNATTGKMSQTPQLPQPDTQEDEIIIESPTEKQEVDPRCFVVSTSPTQLHGMRPGSIREDEVYCPWSTQPQ